MRQKPTVALAVAVTALAAITIVSFSLSTLGIHANNPASSQPTASRAESQVRGDGGAVDALEVTGYVTVSVTRDGMEIYHYDDHNLITDAGRDFISAQIGSTAPSANGANYIALSSDATAPAATDTTLLGEISGSGLDRAQGTYSHTAGTNTFTVVNAFTATGSVSSIQKAGLFTASSGGTMMAENTFSSVNLIAGDQLTITWTVTIG